MVWRKPTNQLIRFRNDPSYEANARARYIKEIGQVRFIERSAVVQACLLHSEEDAIDAIETPPAEYLCNNPKSKFGPWESNVTPGIGRRDFLMTASRLGQHPPIGAVGMRRGKLRLYAHTWTPAIKWVDRVFHPRIPADLIGKLPESVKISMNGMEVERVFKHPNFINTKLTLEKYWSVRTWRHAAFVNGQRVETLRIEVQQDLLTYNEAINEIKRLYLSGFGEFIRKTNKLSILK